MKVGADSADLFPWGARMGLDQAFICGFHEDFFGIQLFLGGGGKCCLSGL